MLAAERQPDNARYVFQWSQQRHQQAMDSPNEVHWSIEVAHRWVGYILLGDLHSTAKSLNLRRIVVTEKGHGYGRQALRYVQQFAFEQAQAQRLWLDVKPDNHRALALYRSVGFVEDDTGAGGAETETEAGALIMMFQQVSEYAGFD